MKGVLRNLLLSGLLGGGLTGVSFGQTNSLVYEGVDGRLVYGTYANQGQTNAVNTIPDFSRAGYKGGGVPIPFIPASVVVTNEPGDDTTLIQNAIDTVSALPVGTNGFRGAVLIKAGDYEVSSTLTVSTDGVVIRGEGQQASGGTKITLTATVQTNLFEISGSGSPSTVGGTTQTITDSYVPVGAKSFNVANASAFSPGDEIRTHHKMNNTWIVDIGMDDLGAEDPWTTNTYQLYHERVVTAVTGNTVYVDAPFVQAVETQYGGADVFEYTFSGQLRNIGIEGLRLESTYTNVEDEAHGWIGVKFNDVRDGWVRQVTARHFGYSCVSINGTCHFITVQDCAQLDPKSVTTGGRKYSFNLDDSTFVLMQRCYTRSGRHDFVSGSKTPGPNVFVDCLSENTLSDIGPHHRYATGQLYDNLKGGGMNVQNRYDSGSGHGWSGAQILFWNCDASGMVCESPTGAMNWSIGNIATRNNGSWVDEPDGIWESHNTHITRPRSLYYKQLEDRRGLDERRDVMLPEQEEGAIWTAMSAWAGEGRFGDAVVAWTSESAIMPPTNSVSLRGRVRDLIMLENGITSQWAKVSGPGNVLFGSATNLATTATFSTAGVYVLRLTAGDGLSIESDEITVVYGDAAPAVDVAAVDVSSATNVTLNGTLLGGGPADLYLFWDIADQGTNAASWANSAVLTNRLDGGFSYDATGLLYGYEYSYRVLGSNVAGATWSGVTNFITAPPDSGYILLEDFETRTLDTAINGQGDWSGNTSDTNDFSVRLDPDDAGNQVLYFNHGTGDRVALNSDAILIPDGGTGTFYFRMRGIGVETGLLMSIRPQLAFAKTPSSLSQVGPETSFRDYGGGDIRYTDAGSLVPEDWYRVWLVVDNASDTFDSYVQREGFSQSQASNGKAFRNATSNALVSFMLYTLSGGSNGDSWFDDIYIAQGQDLHLVDPLAAPTYIDIAVGSASNVGAFSADLGGLLEGVDSVFDVYVHWSTNNHAGPAGWQADASATTLQAGTFENVSSQSVSAAASSLLPMTTYYYTYSISNAATSIWASSSASFITGVGTVDVSVTTASDTGGGQATLNGELVTGGPADLYVVWDLADRGTNLSAWANTNILGSQPDGLFGSVATGLLSDVSYTYRCFASNAFDSAWSGASSFSVPALSYPSSRDYIRGERESGAGALGYFPDSIGSNVGTGGSSGSRDDRNVVFGYTLPTLRPGHVVTSATFAFEITAARDSTGAANLPDLDVYILDSTTPDGSGTTFFYHGPGDPATNVVLAYSTSVTISGTSQNNFADDAEDRSAVLTGSALDLIKSFYGGDHIPDRSEIFFRFNMDEDPAVTSYRRYIPDYALDESFFQVFAGLNPDADGDGMLDSWEITQFGNTTASDGSGDYDSDGFLDLHEFLAGTEATNSLSLLHVESVAGVDSNQVVLSWPGVAGKTYQILYKTNLLDVIWSTNASGIPGVAPTTVSTNVLPGLPAFFKIRLE